MKRRKFIKNTSIGVAGVTVSTVGGGVLSSCCDKKTSENSVSVNIPLPIQVVIDDVGWRNGIDGSNYQHPFRTGIIRNHVISDYQAIIDLGKALEIKPQAAMVLCEWDKENILRSVPHSTWMDQEWDNSKMVGPWIEEAADLINSNRNHFEIAIHGVGHEWWDNGILSRAEWADENGIMRPKDDIERHLDAFSEIMRQNNLGDFPTSFVPTNFAHCFGVSGGNDLSMAEILSKRGFTNINTHYGYLRHKERSQFNYFGIDSGVLTVERKEDRLQWNIISKKPEGEIIGPTCGMHWPNLLHENPERNTEIVDAWIKYLEPYQDHPDKILAKNSLTFQQQLVHREFTKVDVGENTIHLDFSDTNNADTILTNNELTVKVISTVELNFTSDSIKIVSEKLKKNNDLNLYTLHLKKRKIAQTALLNYNPKS